MHFGLTEEQELLQQTLRDFATAEASPPRLREIFDSGTGFDEALWKGAAEIGLQGLAIAEQHGGGGFEFLDLALAFEVIGESALPGPFLGHALAALAIARAGSPAQQEQWLPRLATGDVMATLAIAEERDDAVETAWSPQDWSIALEAGRLRGTKTLVEATPRTELFIVGCRGGSLALVEGGQARVEPDDAMDRTRPLATVELDATTAELLPGDIEETNTILDAGRILLAAEAFGAAWRLVRMTVEYVLTREQFGTRLGQFQGIKHELANHASDIEPARGLVWYAAHAFDHLPEERALEAAVAKAHVVERAVAAGRSAVELHGGIGFTWECDVQFWLKRTLFARSWLGSPRAHRERVALLAGW